MVNSKNTAFFKKKESGIGMCEKVAKMDRYTGVQEIAEIIKSKGMMEKRRVAKVISSSSHLFNFSTCNDAKPPTFRSIYCVSKSKLGVYVEFYIYPFSILNYSSCCCQQAFFRNEVLLHVNDDDHVRTMTVMMLMVVVPEYAWLCGDDNGVMLMMITRKRKMFTQATGMLGMQFSP